MRRYSRRRRKWDMPVRRTDEQSSRCRGVGDGYGKRLGTRQSSMWRALRGYWQCSERQQNCTQSLLPSWSASSHSRNGRSFSDDGALQRPPMMDRRNTWSCSGEKIAVAGTWYTARRRIRLNCGTEQRNVIWKRSSWEKEWFFVTNSGPKRLGETRLPATCVWEKPIFWHGESYLLIETITCPETISQ